MKNKSKKKTVLFIFIVVSILIILAIVYLLSNLNIIVKNAIEKYGSESTLTAVRVNNVDIKLKNGTCEISKFTIENPDGFNEKKLFSVNKIDVGVDILSFKDDALLIKKIIIKDPEIFVEINKKNKNNLLVLKNNLYKSNLLSSEDSSLNEKEPRLNIKYVFLKGGNISVLVKPFKDKTYQMKLPSIKMRNLRGTATEISNQILSKIINKTLVEVKKKGIKFLKDKYGDQVKKELNKKKNNLIDKLKRELKN